MSSTKVRSNTLLYNTDDPEKERRKRSRSRSRSLTPDVEAFTAAENFDDAEKQEIHEEVVKFERKLSKHLPFVIKCCLDNPSNENLWYIHNWKEMHNFIII